LHSLLKALQFVPEPGLESVCIECAFVIPMRWANIGNGVFKDPIWAGIRNGGKPSAEAKQCADVPPQLTTGERAGMLRELFSQKGDTRMGIATRADSYALAKDFLGSGYRGTRDGKGWVSADGLRVYRFPKSKNSQYADTGVQSNFQVKTAPNGQSYVNGHLNIAP
jgi:hypothetical protein